MKNSQKNVEYVIMMVNVQLYMKRLHIAMKGMKFLKAEKCRLDYWKRFLTKVRRAGLFPMWEDFNNYLLQLPAARPNISEREFKNIIYSVTEVHELYSNGELNLSNALLEIAFNDYLYTSFKGFKYLSKDQKEYRVSSFWQRIAWLNLICKTPYTYLHYQKLLERFEFPEVLRIDTKAFDQAKRKSIQYFTEVS